jgi:hypothetical protein
MAVGVAAMAPGAAGATSWHLYRADCEGGTAAAEIACGTLGRYLINQIQPPDCQPKRFHTNAVIQGYPPAESVETSFPTRARRLGDSTLTTQSGKTAIAGLMPAPAPSPREMAVVDFDGAHGDSTTYLAGYVAGPNVTARLVPLNRPDLDEIFGRVNDLQVLAALCSIAEAVDGGQLAPPETINMSFGRRAQPDDPVSVADCQPPRMPDAACEIAYVVDHLQPESTFVAAAGNHRERLFPGSLAGVLGAGMLDLTSFFHTGDVRAAWETPAGAQARMPGNSLCLGSWAAPAGSSYSSALLAGWILRVLRRPDVLASLPQGVWEPRWNAEAGPAGCYVLARGGQMTNFCNTAISALFDELSGNSAPCWSAASEPTITALATARPYPPDPSLLSADAWGAPTTPQPESDPCVPCTGVLLVNGLSLDLRIDLSQSDPLPSGIVLDEVSLRVEDEYYRLSLTEAELEAMTAGQLAALFVPDMGGIVNQDVSLSLWYQMKPPLVDCAGAVGSCYWSSTPMLLDK